MNSSSAGELKRLSLYVLIASVGLSALLGIAAILMGDFGELEIRILLTTLTISAASLCCLSCGALGEVRELRGLPAIGIGLALFSALLLVGGIWGEPRDEVFWKTTATAAFFAVATAHVSLLLLARLAPSYAWAHWAAHVVVFGVATILTIMIWFELDDEWLFRLLGVVGILDGAITIVVPVLHRLSREEFEQEQTIEKLDREIADLRNRLGELERERERFLAENGGTGSRAAS